MPGFFVTLHSRIFFRRFQALRRRFRAAAAAVAQFSRYATTPAARLASPAARCHSSPSSPQRFSGSFHAVAAFSARESSYYADAARRALRYLVFCVSFFGFRQARRVSLSLIDYYDFSRFPIRFLRRFPRMMPISSG